MAEPNLAIICPHCQVPVAADAHGWCSQSLEEEWTEFLRYTLVQCPECRNPLLLKHLGFYVGGEDGEGWEKPVILYPGTAASFGGSVPAKIEESYAEALRSFNHASAYTGTAILCRRTLEGICSHFGEKKGNLAQKLKSLKEREVIDSRVFQWSDDVLRALGNDAAHNVDQVIEQRDAKAALDFTKAIIEYIFVFQAAYDRFKAEREERKALKAPKEEEPA